MIRVFISFALVERKTDEHQNNQYLRAV